MAWTDKRILTLRQLAAFGLTARQIAMRMEIDSEHRVTTTAQRFNIRLAREIPITLHPIEVTGFCHRGQTQIRRPVRLPKGYRPSEPLTPGYMPSDSGKGMQFGVRLISGPPESPITHLAPSPFGEIGDLLLGREETRRRPMLNFLTGEPLDREHDCGVYTADGEDVVTHEGFDFAWWYKHDTCPAGHMPRWASRFLLRVKDVRIEAVSSITDADAVANGMWCDSDGWIDHLMPSTQCCTSAAASFETFWRLVYGAKRTHSLAWVADVEREPMMQAFHKQ